LTHPLLAPILFQLKSRIIAMFTGLIETIGEIKKTAKQGSGLQLTVQSTLPREEITLGESIAVDGACLTVTGFIDKGFTVDVSPETLQRTTLNRKKIGDRVNLERALRLSDRLGGHLVTGHVDGIGSISSLDRKGDFTEIHFAAPENILKYILEKGCVAVDGISLTVNTCSSRDFTVMIIPHTLSRTTLLNKKAGDQVNIENDIIGKYVEKFLIKGDNKGVTRELLEKFNFS
jgi:riboflavin synthase